MTLAFQLQAGPHLPFACTHRRVGVPRESPEVESILMWPSLTSKAIQKWQGPLSTQDPKALLTVWHAIRSGSLMQPQEGVNPRKEDQGEPCNSKKDAYREYSVTRKICNNPHASRLCTKIHPQFKELLTEQTGGKEPNTQSLYFLSSVSLTFNIRHKGDF